MSSLVRLTSLEDFAAKVGLPKYVLTRYIFQANSFYKTFKISKRSNRGHRVISEPSRKLKGIQKWIKVFILDPVPLSNCAMGYRAGRSIKDNALPHVGMDFVCTIDLQDFFPSITTDRIAGVFKSLGYTNDVAYALSRLTTFKNRLPQGAPSSPGLSNIILRRLDSRLSAYCARRKWNYTRYCDDLTFSGSGSISPHTIQTIQLIIESENFRINHKKTRVRRRCSTQVVTGLVVNEFPNLTRQRRKNIRALFHQARLYSANFLARLSELEGILAHFRQIRPHDLNAINNYAEVIQALKIAQGNM